MVLPPLPPASTWSATTLFPRRAWTRSLTDHPKVLKNRITLASKSLCDDFVRALGIREGEVVLEVNAGPGQMTRSLVQGGETVSESEMWRRWREQQARVAAVDRDGEGSAPAASDASIVDVASDGKADTKRPARSKNSGPTQTWPIWDESPEPALGKKTKPLQADNSLSSASQASSAESSPIKPALVIACEPSPPLLERGFDFPVTSRRPTAYLDHTSVPVDLQRSRHVDNLVLSSTTAYRWPTLPDILSDSLVAPYLCDPRAPGEQLELNAQPGSSTSPHPSASKQVTGLRKWDEPEPHMTIVAHIPDSVMGEQMLAQWIGSVVGGPTGRQWIWQWGRIRLAVLCGKGLYSRLMARPREPMNCKLTTMTSALFHRRPLPPYHHVSHIGKSSSRISRTAEVITRSGKPKTYLDPITEPDESDWLDETVFPPTTTLHSDFYPMAPGSSAEDPRPLARPAVLGILLTPRLNSPIIPSQKEAWDYVLRNCFVKEMQPISEGIKNVGFAAETLIPKIASHADEGYRGDPVSPDTVVMDMTYRQWARVVDVFDKWPFRPEKLMIDTSIGSEMSRELGVD